MRQPDPTRHRRLLVIDEDIDGRIAGEIRKRDRLARSLADLGYAGLKDRLLLERLAAELDEYVLVTGDDAMPGDHAELISRLGTTIATIDGRRDAEYATDSTWRRDVLHRWAHAMQLQLPGSIIRYSNASRRRWTRRRNQPRIR